MPNAPTPPPPPPNWDSGAVNALQGSSLNSDGSFKSGGTDYWLFQCKGVSSGDCALVWYGTDSESTGYPRMPLSAAAHALVANGTYKGGGVWEDGGDDFKLERGAGNELTPVAA